MHAPSAVSPLPELSLTSTSLSQFQACYVTCEKTRTDPGGHASGQDVDIRDDKNVTVMGDPLLVQRATHAAVARDSVDVEVLFIEHRRRLVNLAAAITLDRSVAEEVVQDAFVGLQRRPRSIVPPGA